MDKFIDVRRIIISKNKHLLRWFPPFVISWIEHIIHQEDINNFMRNHENDDAFGFCKGIVDEFELELQIEGIEHIPKIDEPCIFVSNHPLGGLDAITIIHLIKDIRPDIKFIVNDLLMNIKNLKNHFIGVDKVGKSASKSLQEVEAQFASPSATFIFPAGLVSRKINGRIEDLEWKKTFIRKAKKYKKKVVPVYIDGALTKRFYRLANIRKSLGIKVNIEMFFLADELFKQKNASIDIAIGEPLPHGTFTSEKKDSEWADWVKQRVYELKKA